MFYIIGKPNCWMILLIRRNNFKNVTRIFNFFLKFFSSAEKLTFIIQLILIKKLLKH